MTAVWLNGRRAAGWEQAAIERAIEQDRERDARVLAGVLTEVPAPVHEARPATDLVWDFS